MTTARQKYLVPLTLAVTFVLALSALLELSPRDETSLDLSYRALRGWAAHDSWKPMFDAWTLPEARQGDGLYERLFFTEQTKFQYAPTSLLVFDGLALFGPSSFDELKAAGNLISRASLALLVMVVFYLLTPPLRPPRQAPIEWLHQLALAAAFCLLFYPFTKGLHLGQIQSWITCLIAAAVAAWSSGRPATSGVLVALAALLKPQYGLLLVWGLLRREWRYSVAFFVTGGVFGIVSLFRYGFGNHLEYLGVLSFLSRHGESYYPNQSINGLTHRLLGNGNNLEWVQGFPPFSPLVYTITLVTSLCLLGLALIPKSGTSRESRTADLTCCILAMTIASPIAWEHHYGILLPIAACVFGGRCGTLSKPQLALVVTATIAAATLNEWPNALADTPFNPLQSGLLVAALACLGLLVTLRARPRSDTRRAVDGGLGATLESRLF